MSGRTTRWFIAMLVGLAFFWIVAYPIHYYMPEHGVYNTVGPWVFGAFVVIPAIVIVVSVLLDYRAFKRTGVVPE